MPALRLRCKTECGTQIIKQALQDTSSLEDLMKSIQDMTGIELNFQKIMLGFPPTRLNTNTDNRTTTLKSLSIKSGDTFTVENIDPSKPQPKSSCTNSPPMNKEPEIKRNEVPADNSCLFYSVFYVLNGYLNYDAAKELRAQIAQNVVMHPDKFNMAVLGKTPEDYSAWIQSDTSWGGAIELSILSEIYQLEIAAIDIKTTRMDIYGQDAGYSNRVFVVYDGIHYDPLYLESNIKGVPPQMIFPTSDVIMLTKVLEFGETANKARQYTDTANFTVRCLNCSKQLKGQEDAMKHAKETGHGNFGEI